MKNYDLAIVGGGIVGASLAYHAARLGARTLLIDREDEGRATDAGAGIVSPETTATESAALHALGRLAAAYYPELLGDLDSDTGYQRCGTLVVAANDWETQFFDELTTALARRHQESEETAPLPQEIEPRAALEMYPPLGLMKRCLWSPEAARIDGRKTCSALSTAAKGLGVEVLVDSVSSLILEHKQVLGVRVGEEDLTANAVVIAGGAWSPTFAAQLSFALPVEPQRGQIAHLHLEGADSENWPMINGFRDHYMVAWPGGRISAGATREEGAGFDPRITTWGVQEVLGEALRVAPGLADATVVEMRVGLRPLSPDGLPVLGRAPGFDNLWLATGHGPSGLTLGPYSAKLVAEAALGGEWSPWLAAFDPARFLD